MPMKSSTNLNTEQDNETEIVISSRKPKAAAATKNASELAEASAAFLELMESGRERIDAIDDQILELIGRRIETAGKMLAEKHSRRMNTRDKSRQSEIYARLAAQAEEFKENGVTINKHQIREVFELLIRLGIENHRKNIIDRR